MLLTFLLFFQSALASANKVDFNAMRNSPTFVFKQMSKEDEKTAEEWPTISNGKDSFQEVWSNPKFNILNDFLKSKELPGSVEVVLLHSYEKANEGKPLQPWLHYLYLRVFSSLASKNKEIYKEELTRFRRKLSLWDLLLILSFEKDEESHKDLILRLHQIAKPYDRFKEDLIQGLSVQGFPLLDKQWEDKLLKILMDYLSKDAYTLAADKEIQLALLAKLKKYKSTPKFYNLKMDQLFKLIFSRISIDQPLVLHELLDVIHSLPPAERAFVGFEENIFKFFHFDFFSKSMTDESSAFFWRKLHSLLSSNVEMDRDLALAFLNVDLKHYFVAPPGKGLNQSLPEMIQKDFIGMLENQSTLPWMQEYAWNVLARLRLSLANVRYLLTIMPNIKSEFRAGLYGNIGSKYRAFSSMTELKNYYQPVLARLAHPGKYPMIHGDLDVFIRGFASSSKIFPVAVAAIRSIPLKELDLVQSKWLLQSFRKIFKELEERKVSGITRSMILKKFEEFYDKKNLDLKKTACEIAGEHPWAWSLRYRNELEMLKTAGDEAIQKTALELLAKLPPWVEEDLPEKDFPEGERCELLLIPRER